ncbi:phosphoribosyltransferase [Sphingomonas sp.]|uniref:phosphoribosyltransferase n=1 Tax=Sphingomonas sp. TaxID=28214 RepID=UPI001E0206B3|nr:phosphoribosyltransferase family protein [Sphingomonas sp.]MBX9795251.1 phosphoribosyltransferase [Sphingomonas sp.]
MPELTPIAHDEFVAGVRVLAAQLADSGWTPDFLIGIGRGGLTPAVFLSHAAGLKMLSVDYSSPVADFSGEPLVKLAARTRAGEKLLFVDDINDTGGTITRLRQELAAAGAVEGAVRFATLIDNCRSIARVDYAARVIDRAVVKDWFVFPWEAVAPTATVLEDAAAVPERTA